jgi:entericidin B
MTASLSLRLAVLAMLALASTGCANTIRGVGQDAANTVDAAQSAGNTVATAAD